MIEQYFPTKRTPVITYQKSTITQPVSTYTSVYESDRAEAKGLSTEEYRKRVALVINELRGTHFNVGDTVWPSRYPELKKHGKCMIVGICRHYDDYGDSDWNEPPYLLSVQPLNDRGNTIQCSVGWVTKTTPITEVC